MPSGGMVYPGWWGAHRPGYAAWTLMLVGLAHALVGGGIFVGFRLTYCGA